jgi:transcriptional regulator with XRE-family HTH domain
MRVLEVEDVIRLLRSQVGQAALAKNAGVDRPTISKILSGRAPLQPKILRALNIRMVFVLASKNEPPRKHPISRKSS